MALWTYRPSPRQLFLIALTLLTLIGISCISLWPRTAAALEANPIAAAWQRAQATGSYHFDSNIVQTTIPAASVTNVGRSSRSSELYLSGQTDLREHRLEMHLWSDGGSVVQAESAAAIKIENGKSYVRQGGEWQESEDFTEAIAPQGDMMAYLRAVRNIQAHPPETRAGITFTRYSFQIDSPRFAAQMRQEFEATLRARGELPPGLNLETPIHFRDMIGSGELWIDEHGLPMRQILHLQFPQQNDEQVQAQLTVDFSKFGETQQTVVDALRNGDLNTVWGLVPASLPDLTPLWLLTGLSLCAGLFLRYRRARVVEVALVIAVIASQILGPILTTYTNVQFFDAQTAKAAAQQETQAAAEEQRELHTALNTVEFDAHLNPLEKVQHPEFADPNSTLSMADAELQLPVRSGLQSPNLQAADPGMDTDGDGLTDFMEASVGSNPEIADSDGDGLDDNREVRGFTFAGKTWYLNPLAVDSNGDGQGDLIEWGLNANATLRTTPQDTDGDQIPDLFDFDNDNDGVPDHKDLAPFAAAATTFTEATPLQLTLNNLTPNQPTVVEFQLRPQDAKHLSFAFNVLDWPQDSAGQMRDLDGATYATIADQTGRVAHANEANGDMKLIPMLEIRLPTNGANLPAQADLTAYNISINNFVADGSTKTAYVPLSVLTDERTGQRVAFGGQMRYLPTGAWPNPHAVRLVWVVQGLADIPCNPEDANAVAQGCQPDGYIYNVLQPLQSYYDDWKLTGLTVREEHGTSIATIYEDPQVDADKKNDDGLAALSYVLDHHFVIGRSDRLPLTEVATLFDRTQNSGFSDDQRFQVPNTLRTSLKHYPSLDQAAAFTAMTETVKLLNDQFLPSVEADRQIKPLLFYAQENRTRQIGLDNLIANSGVSQNGAALTFDLSPGGEPLTIDTIAGIKWAAYCPPASGPISWRPCAMDEYLDVMEGRYLSLPSLPEDAGDTSLVSGRLMLAQLYFIGLANGFYSTVQQGNELFSGSYSLDTENQTAGFVRDSLRGSSTLPLLVGLSYARAITPISEASRAGLSYSLSKWASMLHSDLKNANAGKAVVATGTTQLQAQMLTKYKISRFYGGLAGAAGALLMAATQIASLQPTIDMTTRRALGGIAATLSLGINVILPIVQTAYGLQSGVTTFAKVLVGATKLATSVKIGAGIGLVISVGLTWGFFIYTAATSGLAVGDPQLNRAFFESVASTVVAVFLFLLSLNPIGLIVAGIVAFIDLLLTLICELGVDELRTVPGLGGACFTLSNAAVKYLSYLLYNYDLMIDTERQEFIVTGAPNVTLTDPTKGYVGGNTLTMSLPVTTTVVHKDPSVDNGLYINAYLWLFSADNLRSSTVRSNLSKDNPQPIAVERDQMRAEWQNVTEDHRYVLTPMYRGQNRTTPQVNGVQLTNGLNRSLPVYFNLGYALPAYECVLAVIPYGPLLIPTPICYTRTFNDSSSTPLSNVIFDIFPPTLDAFMTLGDKGNGAFGLAWDTTFPALADADGDGLLSSARNGLDPNDSLVDSDGDGLSDTFELNQRAAGVLLSPILRDTDGDGLLDAQEMHFGTNPAVADTDNDGLLDSEEIWHQRYDPNTGLPTNTWEGGWDVTITGATGSFVVRVSSNALLADSDGDGLSDQAERSLAGQVDSQNRPYHPNVYNTSPINVITASDDFDGFLRLGQSVRYTTTVIANQSVVPGVLNVTAPAALGGSPNPYPLNFSTSPTVTQSSNFTVADNASGRLVLTSTVNTRLPSSGAAGWAWEPVTLEAPLGGIASPFVGIYANSSARPGRQDSYLLAGMTTSTDLNHLFQGDVLAYELPGGGMRSVENDNNNTTARRTDAAPHTACNAAGDCLIVWEERDYCNTLTFNSLRVTAAGEDPGGGIEPGIYLSHESMAERVVWWWDTGGATADLPVGGVRGPNAFGFPFSYTVCGQFTIRVIESDGTGDTPVSSQTIDYTTFLNTPLIFNGNGHTIEVNVTLPPKDIYVVKGAIVGPDGQVKRALDFAVPRLGSGTTQMASFGPVVASNGADFAVAYETQARLPALGNSHIAIQTFDKDGNRVGAPTLHDQGFAPNIDLNLFQMDAIWAGNVYRIAHRTQTLPEIKITDYPGGTITVANDAFTSQAPSIAYDPTSGRTLIVYAAGDNTTKGYVYANNTRIAGPVTLSGSGYYISPQAAYHPMTRSWLVSTQNSNQAFNVQAWLSDLSALLPVPSQPTFPAQLNKSTLSCPLSTSVPNVDLRFEELPGTTNFVDRSGFGNHATCTGVNCPAAGAVGAPNASLSDYGVVFDGVDDGLTLNRTVADDFSITFWFKAAASNTQQMLIDGGAGQANGFHIWLNNGLLAINVPGFNAQATNRIDDGQWHFVAINRNAATGRVEAYVDGVGVIGVFGTANLALNAVTDLRVGRSRTGTLPLRATLDHLQIYPATLTGSTIVALYNRTAQSYCLGAGPSGSNFLWARLQLTQQDTRGGRISATNALALTVDSGLPTSSVAQLTTNEFIRGGQPTPNVTIIGGSATDSLSGVVRVEVSINNGPWQPATGTATWTFPLSVGEGNIHIRTRATDAVGNVETPGAGITVRGDATAPAVTLAALSATPLQPTQAVNGVWTVSLSGTANDTGSGVSSVEVHLQGQNGVVQDHGWQTATRTGNNWSINYQLNSLLVDPTDAYTVTVRATDAVGNRTANNAASGILRLDGTAPIASLSLGDTARKVISETLTLTGLVTDTNSVAGLDTLEIAFTPIEQIAALPPGVTGDEAETLLNRAWLPVTLAQRGAGQATSLWNVAVPAGLEGEYQIDLRATDMLGNVAISANIWRGHIDTLDPRLVMSAEATGVTYRDPASGELRYEMRFVCAAQDRNLNEASFVCPGQGLAEPVRSFDDTSALANLFPDLALRTGLAISYTLWSSTPTLEATVSACDSFGRCASLTNTATANAPLVVASSTNANGPQAVVISPVDGAYVAKSGTALQVTVAAEAADFLQSLRLRLDGTQVGEVTFAQAAAVEVTQQTFSIPHPAVGSHTLVAEATDWTGATQTMLFPLEFTFDGAAPQVAISTVEVSAEETWVLGSGILQFTGTASDDVGLAAVQVKVGTGPWADAAFANGTWHIAYPVPDPEGQVLTVQVRAIDLAGQQREVSQEVPVNFSVPIPPDTTISSGPANPSTGPSVTFTFTGTAGTSGLAAFECRLNEGLYQPCSSPWTLDELSQGPQTVAVRAVDSQGYVDPTPASFEWIVTAGPLAVAITAAPSNPTVERSASFSFVAGGVTGYECKLTQASFGADTASFTACVSGISYSGLADGQYTFEVRARNGEQIGQATRHTWQVINEAPVAHDQQLTTLQPEPVTLTLTAEDGDPLTFRVVEPPKHGVLNDSLPNLTYTPDTDFFGQDSFTFQANDGQALSNLGTVTINVEERGTLIDQCGGYTVYQRGDGSYAAYARIDSKLSAWAGNILVGTAVQNNLVGTAGNDLILGLAGNDVLNGKAGDDLICGGEGNDLIYGELGTDYLDGGNHNDVLNGGTGDFDVLLGRDGSDTLLDPDGVADLQGGPGNEQINLSLRNGWRTPDGKTEFKNRFAAGLGNDTVTFGILGTDIFTVDITGDEWADMAGEGTADTIRFAGRIDQTNSQFRKFEGQVIIATSELPLITDETGFEFWEDVPVGEEPTPEEPGGEEPTPPISEPLQHQLYLPVIGK